MSNPVLPPVLQRLRAEYLEMPGLALTPGQVQRLCGIDEGMCEAALRALVDAGFLGVRADGSIARISSQAVARSRPAKASLEPGMSTLLARLRTKAG